MKRSPIKVVKFGGSSLADAEQFKKVRDIVLADPERRYVVPSAPGKRFDGDKKVTDMLIACHGLSVSGGDWEPLFSEIRSRYESIVSGLSLSLDLSAEFAEIGRNIREGTTRDYVASRGEYLNGIIAAALLNYDFIDAAELIRFNDDRTFNAEETNSMAALVLSQHRCAVIPGFYGSAPDGSIVTFSRGGSDITGAIIARACVADMYENWTDVSGFLKADPRIVTSPKNIKYITYHELRELSYMGATVLHEDSIFPVKLAGIPINIRNTNRPQDEGTLIVASSLCRERDGEIVTGIAGRKGFSAINIEKDMMNQEIGFGVRVLNVLADRGISFEHLPSGIDTMSVMVATPKIEGHEDEIMSDLMHAVNPDSIEIEHGLALIAVVGRSMIKQPGTAARVFTALAVAGINIRMIDQGSSELNIIIGVSDDDFNKAIRAVYDEFIS